MGKYVIFTDSGCDISDALLKEWGVESIHMCFRFDGEDREYSNADLDTHDFYDKMRAGSVSRTAAPNMEDFRVHFVPHLKDGNDILYLGFSSGLSNTVNAGAMAARELQEQYPQRKIVVVGTLCASGGEGLILYMAMMRKKEGAPLEQVAQMVQENIPRLCHWFTVDDLVYLKRGGRVSSTAAFLGGALNIKPVLHVDDEGHLISMSKAHGRKQSIMALVQKYEELADDAAGGVYFIHHGDCLEDAKRLESLIMAKGGKPATLIDYIGPVIGSHSGPGTLALFFIGRHR